MNGVTSAVGSFEARWNKTLQNITKLVESRNVSGCFWIFEVFIFTVSRQNHPTWRESQAATDWAIWTGRRGKQVGPGATQGPSKGQTVSPRMS